MKATVDARIAADGGTRRNARAAHGFPGMVDDRDWRKTAAHDATAWYGCARCGQKFTGPHAVYGHMAKRHHRGTRPEEARRRPPVARPDRGAG